MLTLRSEREIGKLRRAGLAVWYAHQIAARMIRPGVTTGEIDVAIDRFYAEIGAEPLFKGVPGRVPFPAATCTSVNDQLVHGIPGDRALADGDILSIDTGCRYDGWCGDAAVTHAIGSISDEKRKLLDVTQQTLQLAIDLIGKKERWSEVASEMEAYVKDHGYSVVEDYVGHGIGREMWESPQVPNYVNQEFRRTGDFRLQPGLVIAIEPMVNVGKKQLNVGADHWTLSTVDGKPCAHFEHSVAIRESGAFVLTGPPEDDAEIADFPPLS